MTSQYFGPVTQQIAPTAKCTLALIFDKWIGSRQHPWRVLQTFIIVELQK